MFSGIIEHLVKPKQIKKDAENMLLSLPIPKNWQIEEGESINIDGVCSTVQQLDKDNFTVYYMPETLRKTTFKDLSPNHLFNLEKCLTLNTLIGGHLVSGHIDTTAKVTQIKPEGEALVIRFNLKPEFTKYIIYKGSITINGVSLTVVQVTENAFTVSLIPYTLTNTNLGMLKIGDLVNVEIDLISKYLEKLLKK